MVKKNNHKAVSKRSSQEKQEFEKHLQKIEDPNYDKETNFDLPENPTPLQVAKFEICQEILGYKLKNNLTREQIAAKVGLSKSETEEILFCRIDNFTLDRLVEYASKLLDPTWVKVVLEPKKSTLHAKTL